MESLTHQEESREGLLDKWLHPDNVNYVGSLLTGFSAFASIATNIYTAYLIGTEKTAQLILVPSIQSLLLFITLVFISLSYRRKLIRIGEKDTEIARLKADASLAINHNVDISKHRMLIAQAHYNFCAELQSARDTKRFSGLDTKFERYLDEVLENTAKLFSIYTGDTCAACIKIFTKGSDGALATPSEMDRAPAEYVRTLRRDPTSREFRKPVDSDPACSVYLYKKNAAFFSIVDLKDMPDYYIENDLKALGNSYWSENAKWKALYNATAVVPIKRPEYSAQQQCAALLCVDNKAGRFDKERCLYILLGIAIELYYGLRTFLVLMDQAQNGVTP